MINTIDYSKYTLIELLDIKNTIDPDVAGENYSNLIKELESRKGDIRELEVQQTEIYLSTIFSKFTNNKIVERPWFVYFICIWPFFSFYVFGGNIVGFIIEKLELNSAISLPIGIILFLFSVILCVDLFRLKTWAYKTIGYISGILTVFIIMAIIGLIAMGLIDFIVITALFTYGIISVSIASFVFKKSRLSSQCSQAC